MQPEEIPTVELADAVPDNRLDTAIVAIATAHSQVQNILINILVRPSTLPEKLTVKRLGEMRDSLWDTLKRVAGDDPRFIKIGRDA